MDVRGGATTSVTCEREGGRGKGVGAKARECVWQIVSQSRNVGEYREGTRKFGFFKSQFLKQQVEGDGAGGSAPHGLQGAEAVGAKAQGNGLV